MLTFRPIRPEDDAAMAAVIRAVMPEFGADGPGFAIHDPEVDHMSAAYAGPGAAYFVVVDATGQVVGGAGVAPLEGGEPGVCELRKMYFLPAARGQGRGGGPLEPPPCPQWRALGVTGSGGCCHGASHGDAQPGAPSPSAWLSTPSPRIHDPDGSILQQNQQSRLPQFDLQVHPDR